MVPLALRRAQPMQRALNREDIMPRVSLNEPTPDFELPDFSGRMVRLSDLRGKKKVLLVFNRTFA